MPAPSYMKKRSQPNAFYWAVFKRIKNVRKTMLSRFNRAVACIIAVCSVLVLLPLRGVADDQTMNFM